MRIQQSLISIYLLLSMLLLNKAFGQTSMVYEMNNWLNQDLVELINSPIEQGNISNLFDENENTSIILSTAQDFTIQIKFSSPISLEEVAFLFNANGHLDLFTADNELDFILMQNSYQHFPNIAFESDLPSSFSLASTEIGFLALSVNSVASALSFHELQFFGDFDLSGIFEVCPQQLQIERGNRFDLAANLKRYSTSGYPFNSVDEIDIQIEDQMIMNQEGFEITGLEIGSTQILLSDQSQTEFIQVCVLDEHRNEIAPPQTTKVFVVIDNPFVPGSNTERFHEYFNWMDPEQLNSDLVTEFESVNQGVVDFQIVDQIYLSESFSKIQGQQTSVEQWFELYSEPDWVTLREYEMNDEFSFDYEGLLNELNLTGQINDGTYTEVWIWAHPFAGLNESRMAGPDAFWINGPILDYPGLTKKLPIMGFNYERTVDLAMHSYGHRVENTMRHVFGRWDNSQANQNLWEKFTTYNLLGTAQIGNIHFPPNGVQDYDYENTNIVNCFSPDWSNFPYFKNRSAAVNCEAWSCSQLGYMRWWFEHLPRYLGKREDILNNWWSYVVDYDSAIATQADFLCANEDNCSDDLTALNEFLKKQFLFSARPTAFSQELDLNYSFSTKVSAVLSIYNLKGQLLKTESVIVKDERQQLTIDLNFLSSGIYILNLQQTKYPFLSKSLKVVKQ